MPTIDHAQPVLHTRDVAQTLATLRRRRDARRAAGHDVAALERDITQLEQVLEAFGGG